MRRMGKAQKEEKIWSKKKQSKKQIWIESIKIVGNKQKKIGE